jgi:tetratricopeptide (TPR) repeat protein
MKNQKLRFAVASLSGALVLAALSSTSRAQYPAGQDGHANDANNRVGSNGFNTPRSGGGTVSGNNIVTGNVTAGKEFRGPVPYRDPRAFTGPVGGGFNEDFVKNSSGVPSSYGAPSNNASAVRPFYGDRRAVAPPAGSLPEGFNGGYIGSTLTSPYTMSYSMNAAPGAEGLQSRTLNRDTLELNARLNESGYPGLAPPSSQLDPMLPSPLWGTQQPGSMAEKYGMANYDLSQLSAADRFAMQNSSVQSMQRELQEAAGFRQPAQQQGLNPRQPGQNGPNNNQENDRNSPVNNPLNQPLDKPLEAPADAALNGQPTGSTLKTGPLNSSTNNQESIRNRLEAPPPAMQSAQLQELQKRMERYNGGRPMTDEEAQRQFQDQKRRADALAAQKRIESTTPLTGGAGGQPGPTTPLVIQSLASGVKARGLHDLLASAETLMRDSKFEQAIDKYNQAARVAPNNVLAPLGRAIAELGAGYYAQADRDLHLVYRGAPELLYGQIDLSSMLNPQRLNFVRRDLTGLTQSDSNNERPWFLLAFVAYNSGDATEAQRALDQARANGGGMDRLIPVLKEHWTASGMNKGAGPTTAPAGQ